MESAFKFMFSLGVLLFGLISMGIFLLIIRIILIFTPVVHFMGLQMTVY